MKYIIFLYLTSFSISAQIRGVVKDSLSGEPIPFVNIWVKNENIATTSEIDGSFFLETKPEKNIIFSILVLETKQIEIGNIKNTTFQAFDNGPKVEAKFFPYDKLYSKTRFIKQVTIFTDSRIDSATIKLHFYKVDKDGAPGEEFLTKDYIVTL